MTDKIMTPAVRPIAFHLPQFHPIPENDLWWGKGFTEWTNVAKARPLFPGHYQPHLPADLGFYDLRLPEARQAQADLAREYGVHAFCYWHYWFNGKRLIERPVNEIIESGSPDFPFCLAWANETWSRRWTGEEREILMKQDYGGDADDRAHIRWLMAQLADPRCVRIHGKPVFLVYRPYELPDPVRTTDTWREEVHRAGLPGIYLIAIDARAANRWVDPRTLGFDAGCEFHPHGGLLADFSANLAAPSGPGQSAVSALKRVAGRAEPLKRAWRRYKRARQEASGGGGMQLFEYRQAVELTIKWATDIETEWTRYPCVCPRWDNSPRRGSNALILTNDDPELYGEWLARAAARVAGRPADERIVFINAWNEWAEGNHLEPDHRYGHAYLEATRRVLEARPGTATSAGATMSGI